MAQSPGHTRCRRFASIARTCRNRPRRRDPPRARTRSAPHTQLPPPTPAARDTVRRRRIRGRCGNPKMRRRARRHHRGAGTRNRRRRTAPEHSVGWSRRCPRGAERSSPPPRVPGPPGAAPHIPRRCMRGAPTGRPTAGSPPGSCTARRARGAGGTCRARTSRPTADRTTPAVNTPHRSGRHLRRQAGTTPRTRWRTVRPARWGHRASTCPR